MSSSSWRSLRLRITLLALGLLLLAASLAGCEESNGGIGPGAAEPSVRAATSLELFADMVRNVGGERVVVEALLPPGADPHTYELTPNRVADVARADVIFINGLALEKAIQDVIDANATGPVIELAEGLPVIGAGEGNPHLWLDVRLAARYVERIRDALIGQDPAGRTTYEANAAAYLGQLGDLDREMEDAVNAIPPERRKLVTFHDAFPYLAARYGLEIVAVAVPSPGQEPSAQRIAGLTQTLRDGGVPAVYKEPQFNADILEQAADEARVRVLDLLSDAYADRVDSYVGLIRFDMQQLLEGLNGD